MGVLHGQADEQHLLLVIRVEDAGIDLVAGVDSRQDFLHAVIQGTAFAQLLIDGFHRFRPAQSPFLRFIVDIPQCFFHLSPAFRCRPEAVISVKDPDAGTDELIHTCQVLPQDQIVRIDRVEITDDQRHLRPFLIQFRFLGAEEIIRDQIGQADAKTDDDNHNKAHVTVHEPGAERFLHFVFLTSNL